MEVSSSKNPSEISKRFSEAVKGMSFLRVCHSCSSMYSNKACQEIESQLSKPTPTIDFKKLKSEIIALSNDLTSISGNLPSYGIKMYTATIDNLLKRVNSEELQSQVSQMPVKSFKFKQKPRLLNKMNALDQVRIEDNLKDDSPIIMNKEFTLERGKSFFQNLKHCTISDGLVHENSGKGTSLASGTLHVRKIDSCLINVSRLPFSQGSIFLEDCKNSIIIMKLNYQADFSASNNIQVRLTKLVNCSLCILKEGEDRQVIVMEQCSNCTFHECTRKHIHIQDFSDLNLGAAHVSSNYQFNSFELFDFDTSALKTLIS